ncbi:MAG: hypothetical protein ABJF88_11540 [Rhodothermales bacterium]
MMRLLLTLALLLPLAACDTFSAGDADPARIRTDAEAYTARVADRIVELSLAFTYVNVSGRTAYLHGCGGPAPPSIEKRVGEEWVNVYNPVVALCQSPLTPVAPGDTYRYEFTPRAGLPGSNVVPEWDADGVEGTYRLVWSVEERGDRRRAISNEFELSVEDGN